MLRDLAAAVANHVDDDGVACPIEVYVGVGHPQAEWRAASDSAERIRSRGEFFARRRLGRRRRSARTEAHVLHCPHRGSICGRHRRRGRLTLHGLIHLLAVAEAFGYTELAQLTQPISRAMGVAWLAASILVVAAAATLVARPRATWMVGAAALRGFTSRHSVDVA